MYGLLIPLPGKVGAMLWCWVCVVKMLLLANPKQLHFVVGRKAAPDGVTG